MFYDKFLLKKEQSKRFIAKNKEKFERCCRCKQITNIPINTPIDFRDNYIEGSGQLCETCAKKDEEI